MLRGRYDRFRYLDLRKYTMHKKDHGWPAPRVDLYESGRLALLHDVTNVLHSLA